MSSWRSDPVARLQNPTPLTETELDELQAYARWTAQGDPLPSREDVLLLWHFTGRAIAEAQPDDARELTDLLVGSMLRVHDNGCESDKLLFPFVDWLDSARLADRFPELVATAFKCWRADPESAAGRKCLKAFFANRVSAGRTAEAAAVALECERDDRERFAHKNGTPPTVAPIIAAWQQATATAAAGLETRAYDRLVWAAGLLDGLDPTDAAKLRGPLCAMLAKMAFMRAVRAGQLEPDALGQGLAAPDEPYPLLIHRSLLGLPVTGGHEYVNERCHAWLRHAMSLIQQADPMLDGQDDQHGFVRLALVALIATVHHNSGDAEAANAALQAALTTLRQRPERTEVTAQLIAPVAAGILVQLGDYDAALRTICGYLAATPEVGGDAFFGPWAAHLLLLASEATLLRAGGRNLRDEERAQVAEWLALAVADEDRFLDENIAPMSETARMLALGPVLRRLPRVLGMAHAVGLTDGAEAEPAYGVVLRRKWRATARTIAEWRWAGANSNAEGLLHAVREAKRKLAEFEIGEHAIEPAKRADLVGRLGDAELQLSWHAPSRFPEDEVDVPEIKVAVGQDRLLIDYIAFEPPGKPPRYGAFVVDEEVRFVDLGPTAAIDSAVTRWLALIERGSAASADERRAASEEVARLVLEPATGRKRMRDLVVSPWGNALNRLPWAALPTGYGEMIVDSCAVRTVPSSRFLVAHPEGELRASGRAAIFGRPDFSAGLDQAQRDALLLEQKDLVETEREAHDVANMLDGDVFVGERAAKRPLLALERPSVLHLATHGWVSETGKRIHPARTTMTSSLRMVGGIALEMAGLEVDFALSGDAQAVRADWLRWVGSADTQVHLALVLAGFHAWSLVLDDIRPGFGNGLVTASEFATLDLFGTELVVLSACASGLGQLIGTESSVVGLRRAALLAGAEATVSALWRVPDGPTADLMIDFHHHRRSGLRGTEALRAAQARKRAEGAPERDWAAFVFEGRG